MSTSSAVLDSTLGFTPITSDVEELHLEGRVQAGIQGVTIRRLRLSVPGAGPEATLDELRPLSTHLVKLEVAIDLELLLASFLDVQELHCTKEGNYLVVEAHQPKSTFLTRISFIPGPLGSRGDERTLLVHLGVPTRMGAVSTLDEDVLSALERGLSYAFGGIARCSPHSVLVDPLAGLLRSLFPRNGWKIPSISGLYLHTSITKSAVLVLSISSDQPLSVEPEVMHRLAGLREHLEAYGFDEALPDPKTSYGQDVGRLQADFQAKAIRDRVLWAGPFLSEVVDETWSLALRTLTIAPSDESALSTIYTLVLQRKTPAVEIAQAVEQYAAALRAEGERIRPSLILLFAAPYLEGELRVRFLEDAVAWSPNEPRTLKALAEALVPMRRLDAAVRALRRLAMVSSSSEAKGRVHLQAARLLVDSGELVGAQRELDRARLHTPKSMEVVTMLASIKAQRGDVLTACLDLQELANRPDTAIADRSLALETLARIKLDYGYAAAAVPVVEKAFSIPSSTPTITLIVLALNIAIQAENEDLLHCALEHASDWLEATSTPWTPDVESLHRAAIAACEFLGAAELGIRHAERLWSKVAPSKEEFESFLRLAKTSTCSLDTLRKMASRAADAGLMGEAVTIWMDVWERLPENSRRWPDAWNDFCEVTELHPKSIELLDGAIFIASTDSDPESLIGLIQKRLRLDLRSSEKVELLKLLARSWRASGRPMAAVRTLEDALTTAPLDVEILELLADIHRTRDDQSRLAETLRRLAEASDGLTRGMYQAERGRILATQGEDIEAYNAVVEAIDVGDNAAITWSLATALALRMGRYDEARSRAMVRLKRAEGQEAEVCLPIWVDLLKIAEATNDSDEVLNCLRNALSLTQLASPVGRQLAQQLARELELHEEFDELINFQLKLGRESELPIVERAGWLVSTADRLGLMGRCEEAKVVCEEVLEFLGASSVLDSYRGQSLEILERIAREDGNTTYLARILRRRAIRLETASNAVPVWLEVIATLKLSGFIEEAFEAALQATETFPDEIQLATRMAELAADVGDLSRAADAYRRAALRAERLSKTEYALELHSLAAEAFWASEASGLALHHDEAVVEHALLLQRGSVQVLASLERLEKQAKFVEDITQQIKFCEARTRLTKGAIRVEALEELAALKTSIGNLDDSISVLEAALDELCEEDRTQAYSIEERLDIARASSGRIRDRLPPLERRARVAQGTAAAELWMRAATILVEQLDDPESALLRVRSALRCDPRHSAARALHLELLRRIGPAIALIDTLEDEGSHAEDAAEAASLWVEACRVALQSVKRSAIDPNTGFSRAVDLGRRALAANPLETEALCLAIEAIQELDGRDEEALSLLGQLAVRTSSPAERLCCRLRRARILQDAFDNPMSALTELSEVLEAPEGPRRLALRAVLDGEPAPEKSFLEWGVELSRNCKDAAAEEQFLLRLQSVVQSPELRADLISRRAALLDGEPLDSLRAQRAWLEVLEHRPADSLARASLLRRFLATRKYQELIHYIGVETLEQAWISLPDDEKYPAGKVLWPHLPSGARRAEVMLVVARGLLAEDSASTLAVELLEKVAATGAIPFAGQAWQILAQLRSNNSDLLGAAEAEEARAGLSVDPTDRAGALASVAEYRLGLGEVEDVEVALNLAQATDPTHPKVRSVLRTFLVQQGRFQELGAALGADALAQVVDELVQHSARADEAIAAARALAPLLDDNRGRFWLQLAGRWGFVDRSDLQHQALVYAAGAPSPEAQVALMYLAEQAHSRGDLASYVQWLRQAVLHARSDEDGLERRLQLSAALRAWMEVGGDESQEEIETLLLEARAIKPDTRVDGALEDLWLSQEKYEQLGKILGADRLRVYADKAREQDRPELERRLLRMWASLSIGGQRADALLRLADSWRASGETAAELEAVILAHESDRERNELKTRLIDQLVELKDFDRFVQQLGINDLEQWVDRHGDHPAFPTAGEVLARQWQSGSDKPSAEIAKLWMLVGLRYRSQEQLEDAERAYRAAITLDPQLPEARDSLADMLVELGRYDTLAEIDIHRLTQAAEQAVGELDVHRARSALRALADSSISVDKAEALLELAKLIDSSEGKQKAEILEEAFRADPHHDGVVRELGQLLWDQQQTLRIIEIIGFEALIDQFEAAVATGKVSEALDTLWAAQANMYPQERALANEHAAKWSDPNLSPQEDHNRRRDELLSARFTWDQLGNREGSDRVRMAVVDFLRQSSDVEGYLDALEDAWNEIRDPEKQAIVGLQLAEIHENEGVAEAQEILGSLITQKNMPYWARQRAAMLLLEQFNLPYDTIEHLDRDTLLLLIGAYELILDIEQLGHDSEKRNLVNFSPTSAQFVILASLKEVVHESPQEIAELLQSAMDLTANADERCWINARLREHWDRAGEWSLAESHAALVASHTNAVSDWLALSELRVWTNDILGAEAAAESARMVAPAHPKVYEQMVRLAERQGEPELLAERLEAYAIHDDSSSQIVQADRFQKAAEVASSVLDWQRVSRCLTASLQLDPQVGRFETIQRVLQSIPDIALRQNIYQVGVDSDNLELANCSRAELARCLLRLGQREDALDVIQEGLDQSPSSSSPLILVALSRELYVDGARLLDWANQLADGEAATSLRIEAARRAEAQGESFRAQQAWTQVILRGHGDGSSEQARTALLRLVREVGDKRHLLSVLEDAAEEANQSAAAVELWLEAARVAEEAFATPERAVAVLERAYRAEGDDSLREAVIDIYEKHGHWLALDAWLERQRVEASDSQGCAKWAALRAERLATHLHDLPTAIALYGESYGNESKVEVGYAAAELEYTLGWYEACLFRIDRLLELDPDCRVHLIRLKVEALESLGKNNEFLRLLELELDRTPDAELLFEKLIKSYVGQGKFKLATQWLQMSSETLPKLVYGQRLLIAAAVYESILTDESSALACIEDAEMLAINELIPTIVALADKIGAHEVVLRSAAEAPLESNLFLDPCLEMTRVRSGIALGKNAYVEAQIEELAENLDDVHLPQVYSLQAQWLGTLGKTEDEHQAWSLAARCLEAVDPVRAADIWAKAALACASVGQTKAAVEIIRRVRLLGGDDLGLEEEILAVDVPTLERAGLLRKWLDIEVVPEKREKLWHSLINTYESLEYDQEAEEARLDAMLDADAFMVASSVFHALEANERWEDLYALLQRKVLSETLDTNDETKTKLWLGRLALRLGWLEQGLEYLEGISSRDGSAFEILEVLEQLYEGLGQTDNLLATLDTMAVRAKSERVRRRTLVRAARIHAEQFAWAKALDTLEASVEPNTPVDLRAWAEHIHRWAFENEQPERAASGWVRLASTVDGAEAAAALARAANIRWRYLEERRSALATVKLALRHVPTDGGLSWMAAELLDELGDSVGSVQHAKAMSGLTSGLSQACWLLELARHEHTVGAWEAALDAGFEEQTVLEHLAAAHERVPLDGLQEMLEARSLKLPELYISTPAEEAQSTRVDMERSGRWKSLIVFESEEAAQTLDPRKRAKAWLRIAETYLRVDAPAADGDRQLAIERAVDADPLWPPAMSVALEAVMETKDERRGVELITRLEALQGGVWVAPRFELAAADWSSSIGTTIDWLNQALARDPGNRLVMEMLAECLIDRQSYSEAHAVLDKWLMKLDEVLEPDMESRYRRLRSRLAYVEGKFDEALSFLAPTDVCERVPILEAAGADVGTLSKALEECFDKDGEVRHLIKAAKLGVRLDQIEQKAFAIEAVPELDETLVAARISEGNGRNLLTWVRRLGVEYLLGVPDNVRWETARAAFDEEAWALVADILIPDARDSGFVEVFNDAPISLLVDGLCTDVSAERTLLERLLVWQPHHRGLLTRVARGEIGLAETKTIEDACRKLIDDDASNMEALRSLEKLGETSPSGAGARMVIRWYETGQALSIAINTAHIHRLVTETSGERLVVQRYPWAYNRLIPADHIAKVAWIRSNLGLLFEYEDLVLDWSRAFVDVLGGTRAWLTDDQELVLGLGLVQVGSIEEICFHLARLQVMASSSQKYSPERVGLMSCGSLGAAIKGLHRELGCSYVGCQLSTLEERLAFVRAQPLASEFVNLVLSPELALNADPSEPLMHFENTELLKGHEIGAVLVNGAESGNEGGCTQLDKNKPQDFPRADRRSSLI
ncbi:MAG: hypothetical protein KTR25_06155 [Myxococcales bacterium]|nr:hypothetical protein [Myxococcales bacterium]